MEGIRNPSIRSNQIKISKKRFDKKNKRKNRNYDPLKSWLIAKSEKERTNPKFKVKGKPKGSISIDAPDHLDCKTPSEWEVLIRFIRGIRKSSLEDCAKKIVLNFHEVKTMSPEAAVTIVAEIQRCNAFCKGRTEITGTYPASHDIAWLLDDVGFFRALGIKSPPFPKKYQPNSYIQIEKNHRSIAELADKLLECFSGVFTFNIKDRKRLHIALVECMDNVFEHAYKVESTKPYLYKEWWLAGYANNIDGEIGFTFYDQGSGIPATIRRKKKKRLKERFSSLQGWSDADWIERAVKKGVSRHESSRRGHGLIKLKKFVDELAEKGSLRVISNKGIVEFHSNDTKLSAKLEESMDGTLVAWKLDGVKVVVPEVKSNEN